MEAGDGLDQGHPLENVSGITSALPVVYKWKPVVKFGGITTGKTVLIHVYTTDFHCYISEGGVAL